MEFDARRRPLLELEAVTQHYGVRPVLRDVSVAVRPAELVAVVGPNGMGKSTLLGVLGGVVSPHAGRVRLGGLERRSSIDAEREIRRHAVFLPDRPWLPAQRTPREFILAVAEIYGVEALRRMEHAERLLALFELTRVADAPIRNASAGQQKKTALAATLATDAPVLLLDEPFSGGLDPAGLAALKGVLRRLVANHGTTIVLTSPVTEIVEEIADRVMVLQDGRVLAFDTVAQLRSEHGGAALATVLEKMLHPGTANRIDAYFEGLE